MKNQPSPPLKVPCLTFFTRTYPWHFVTPIIQCQQITISRADSAFLEHISNDPNLLSCSPWQISAKIANYQIFSWAVVFHPCVFILLNVIQCQSASLGIQKLWRMYLIQHHSVKISRRSYQWCSSKEIELTWFWSVGNMNPRLFGCEICSYTKQ